MKNRTDPARGARCSQRSGEASAAEDEIEKEKRTRAADGKPKPKPKKKNRASAPVSGSDRRGIGGEIARSKHRRKLSRSTSQVRDAQKASNEASALSGGENSTRVYSRQKKKRKTRKPAPRSFEVGDDAFAEEDTVTQLATLEAPAAGTHHPPEAKLVRSKSFPKETEMLNQQQIDPSRPYLHPTRDSGKPEEATEGSYVVEDATSTGTKIQISEKMAKFQNPPTFGDLVMIGRDGGNVDRTSHLVDHEQEPQPEGLDWDSNKLEMNIRFYINKLGVGPTDVDDSDDDKFWAEFEEPELTQLKERLALHRIIAHEILKKKQPLDDAGLKQKYPPLILREKGYFEKYEQSLEWYFYPEYCKYVGLQDYQRLVLHNKNEYHNWDEYRRENNTYAVDRQFVKFYEKLASETKWIDKCRTDWKLEWGKIRSLAFYHAAKIATGFQDIYKSLFYSCFNEFMVSIKFDYTFYKARTRLFFELWKRVANQKMNFMEALKQIYEQGMCPSFSFEMKCQLERGADSGSIKKDHDIYTAHIEGEVEEDEVFKSIMERIKKRVPKRKNYYDYIKKKLHVAEEIRLIPREI